MSDPRDRRRFYSHWRRPAAPDRPMCARCRYQYSVVLEDGGVRCTSCLFETKSLAEWRIAAKAARDRPNVESS